MLRGLQFCRFRARLKQLEMRSALARASSVGGRGGVADLLDLQQARLVLPRLDMVKAALNPADQNLNEHEPVSALLLKSCTPPGRRGQCINNERCKQPGQPGDVSVLPLEWLRRFRLDPDLDSIRVDREEARRLATLREKGSAKTVRAQGKAVPSQLRSNAVLRFRRICHGW